ncbi:MAG: trypsin-like serine protease [Sulfuriferula multivorans]|uniref:Trypsin-like serine protease n=1 Tax=Sulfuriferula multivorans TaxID=1559896 RepID=A0A7C9KBT1_9PROT|nr:trypsin-like serine protease [Sulfuriferula multivorans]
MKINEKQIALAMVAALSSTSTLALVGGSIDPNTADSPWAGVGAITINNSVFSGVMLDSTHVLTAAHVVAGQVSSAGNVSFSLNAGSYSQTLKASSISVYTGYTGTTPGFDGVWHDDLAVVTLNAPITGVVGYDLYNGSLSGRTITLVGYGGTGSTVKKVGQNVVDRVLNDDDSNNPSNNIEEVYVFDYDSTGSPNSYGGGSLGAGIEAGYTGGDSGSPVFISVGGQWQIAGIANFNGTSQSGGPIGGGTIVSSYIPWINEQMAAPVPEPGTWAMMLVGMGLVGAAVRVRAKG